jgi:hypothetical protein
MMNSSAAQKRKRSVRTHTVDDFSAAAGIETEKAMRVPDFPLS